jgi:hypothetical protein
MPEANNRAATIKRGRESQGIGILAGSTSTAATLGIGSSTRALFQRMEGPARESNVDDVFSGSMTVAGSSGTTSGNGSQFNRTCSGMPAVG